MFIRPSSTIRFHRFLSSSILFSPLPSSSTLSILFHHISSSFIHLLLFHPFPSSSLFSPLPSSNSLPSSSILFYSFLSNPLVIFYHLPFSVILFSPLPSSSLLAYPLLPSLSSCSSFYFLNLEANPRRLIIYILTLVWLCHGSLTNVHPLLRLSYTESCTRNKCLK